MLDMFNIYLPMCGHGIQRPDPHSQRLFRWCAGRFFFGVGGAWVVTPGPQHFRF